MRAAASQTPGAVTRAGRYPLLLPALTLLVGLLAGGVQLPGLLLGALFVLWVLHGQSCLRYGLWLGVTLGAGLALAGHLLPGFTPLPLSEARTISADAAPYVVRLHWDKLLLGATLLAWWWRRPRPPQARPLPAWRCALATLLAVPALALALGVVAWQPKWPAELAVWLAVNLAVTALAEELLFRGLLQGALVARLGAARGIGLGAALFGLAHAPFSLPFALVAGVAGLGYGWVLQLSGRLYAALLLHGAVNLLHFLLLSYPLRLG
ncbi:CPBP family intramembrane metalloprotease [Pseudomonas sp. MAP12]|uniref:CPBP family intramembrane metalloprotease n=1 Tax=Geopseudomonas aromaticivorans TaxID=2849492 RepID=A0ABS6MU22_9GAMM|nr:CPBP family intramembrane glutamic endopeptidase [Pseudomonas aromaticivorans]MBV2131846.1 CPBP family intramembrane metalloprotease [Pseudomonas aromaticivorans]